VEKVGDNNNKEWRGGGGGKEKKKKERGSNLKVVDKIVRAHRRRVLFRGDYVCCASGKGKNMKTYLA